MQVQTKKGIQALLKGEKYEPRKEYTTRVDGRRMFYRDVPIAEIDRAGRRIHVSMGGYTEYRVVWAVRERLNSLLMELGVDARVKRYPHDSSMYIAKHVMNPERDTLVRVMDPDEWVTFRIPKEVDIRTGPEYLIPGS